MFGSIILFVIAAVAGFRRGKIDGKAVVAAMKAIASEAVEDPELVLNAPHNTRIGRLDEAAAARKPVLRWKPESS